MSIPFIALGLATALTLSPAAPLSAATPAAPVSVAAPAAWGPPLLCRPFDVGEQAGALTDLDDRRGGMDRVEGALTLLAAADDALLHMEALRRTVISMEPKRQPEAVERLLGELERRFERAGLARAAHGGAAGGDGRTLALAALDLAYASEALAEMGVTVRAQAEVRSLMLVATLASPDDGALRLGASLVAFAHQDDGLLRAHLAGALAAATDEQGLLCRNLCTTIGSMLDRTDRAALWAYASPALAERS